MDAQTLTENLLREGRLIEAGWIGLQETLPPSSKEWRNDMRTAFFAGAQHVFESIVAAARSKDANDQQHVQLQLIDAELREFIIEHQLRYAPVAGSA
jgi:hypothetical protein